MEGEDIDGYVSRFERLARQAGYHYDNAQTLDKFTEGLPDKLYETVYRFDEPTTYQQWKKALLD
jgi:hypothetical protein